MAVTDINTLKSWFKRGLKPLASQFEAWIDSYWHKEEQIPTSKIEGLEETLIKKIDREAVAGIVNEAISHIAIPDATLTQKGIVQLSSTPGLTETEAATPLLVATSADAAKNGAIAEAETQLSAAVDGLRGGVPAEGDTLKKLHDLITLLQSLVSSDDVNLDTVKEIVAFIKNNKDVIDTIATSKVAIADIVDSLTSTAANKPLSANQGRMLSEALSATSKAIRLAIGFSVSTEAVTYLPSAATVSKLTWSATDIATVQVSVAGGAFSPATSGTALTLALAAGSPLQVRVTYAAGKTLGSILLEGTYN